jgi:hypothetical protein
VTDWPLAVCDAQTVDAQKDLIDTDIVTRKSFTEGSQVYHSESFKWYYLNNQLASEVVLFRQTDTDPHFATGMSCLTFVFSASVYILPGVPHAGFKNPKSQATERPRESVEARAFVYY